MGRLNFSRKKYFCIFFFPFHFISSESKCVKWLNNPSSYSNYPMRGICADLSANTSDRSPISFHVCNISVIIRERLLEFGGVTFRIIIQNSLIGPRQHPPSYTIGESRGIHSPRVRQDEMVVAWRVAKNKRLAFGSVFGRGKILLAEVEL